MLDGSPAEVKSRLKQIAEGKVQLTPDDVIGVKALSRSAGQVTRELAIRALSKIGDPEALDIARSYLSDAFRHYRAAAAYCLGETGDESDRVRLEALLSDSALAVRQAAEAAITKLTTRLG